MKREKGAGWEKDVFFLEWGEKKMLVEREATNEYFNSGVEYFTLKNCFTELLSSKQK